MNPTVSTAFTTTRWTQLMEAVRPDSADGQEAFAQLYVDYWPPLYSYVRKRGFAPTDAEDITQDFFVALLAKQRLAGLTRDGGRFRSFLLAALKNHLANAWNHAHTARRGGGQAALPLDLAEAESGYAAGFATEPDAERVFARQWAQTLVERVRRRLETESATTGKGKLFAALRGQLQGDGGGRPYAELAPELGLSEGALKVAAHRLRHRFGELLREEVTRTVADPTEVQQELRELIVLLGETG